LLRDFVNTALKPTSVGKQHEALKMKHTIRVLLASVLFLTTTQAVAYTWVKSTEGYDCRITCSEAGWVTPTTDKYKGGPKNFYICMSNINSEGYKAGYSLSHDEGCHVAHEGADVRATDFYCSCG
jgi:hypothetical protein